MQPSVPRQHVVRRRLAHLLIAALSLIATAVVPTGVAQARPAPAPADGLFGALVTVSPSETTLAQFTQLTVSGSGIPVGLATVALGGVELGTVSVVGATGGATAGDFGPTTFAVPPGAATCGTGPVNLIPVTVTVGSTSSQSSVSVFCPALAVTPNPVFSAGAPTDLHFTGTGFIPERTIALALDGQSLPSANSDGDGALSGVIPGAALACGTHQLTATVLPPPPPRIQTQIRIAAVPAAAPPAPQSPAAPAQPDASTTITVLGCASSAPPPQILADPVETGLQQFTQFSVTGFDLAAGPATIKLQGATAGTVSVGSGGTFPTTDFTVPAGAASCGSDAVTIDDTAPAIARAVIAVFCPTVTVTPDPLFSGGAPSDLSIAGAGFPGDRAIDFTIDGRDVGTVISTANGSVTKPVTGIALPCGTHQVVGTAQPTPLIGTGSRVVRPAPAIVPQDPPIPAETDLSVLGCVSSPTPPQIHALPIETTLGQFTRFSVDGSLLPAGPANIRIQGVAAGRVTVDGKGTFPSTGFAVPVGAARCGQDSVTIDDGGPVLATATIAVFCPSITVAPNPVDSGGGSATLTISGTGFPAGRTIDLGFDGQNHAAVTSDGAGSVTGTISGITPACGPHQAVATARPPTSGPGQAARAAVLAFLPVSASAPVTVVGCARITADPNVIQQGMLTHVTGTGFLPKTAVILTWRSPTGQVQSSCSADAVSVPALSADAAGNIDVFCLAFPNVLFGALRLAALQSPELETTSVLVEDGPMQPSTGDQFVFRR